VVIAIISLLAAILFPVFARARENARRASCQSNEKQLALGILQYAQDYDGRLPVYQNVVPISYWFVLIQPYINNYQILRCPDMQVKTFTNGDSGQSSYALTGKNNYLYTLTGRPLDTVTEPARSWMLTESQEQTGVKPGSGLPFLDCNQYSDPAIKPASGAYTQTSMGFRHFDGQNVAFVDGHVKWMLATESTNYIWKP
jgi:prepilin-type processing-associated H-X9-DG protein